MTFEIRALAFCDEQFNLEIEDIRAASSELEPWRLQLSQPMVIEVWKKDIHLLENLLLTLFVLRAMYFIQDAVRALLQPSLTLVLW